MTDPSMAQLGTYVVITPVRDEELYIAHTIDSVLRQTHRPLAWIIVDDGSTDGTAQIIRERTSEVPWVTVLSTDNAERKLGSAEVLAFDRGMAAIGSNPEYDFVVKLDGDVRLEPDYFERVVRRMQADATWGIGSGIYCEEMDGTWLPIRMPWYHAAGASKVMRRACYEQIGGFVARKGWDTVDEIRAGLKGWKTGHFPDIPFRHLKPEGAAMGALGTHRFHGEIYYQTGGGVLFLLAKAGHRMLTGRPYVFGGVAMLLGYLRPALKRSPRLVTAEEAKFYRRMLNRRFVRSLADQRSQDFDPNGRAKTCAR